MQSTETERRWWAGLGLGMALALSGCSSLSPQIFSDRLMTDGTSPKPPTTLQEAYDDAAEVQRRYFTAVRDQGNAPSRLSLGLIGLTAVALYKGMTNPSTDDLIALGVAGSAAYAAGNTLLSATRLDVYRAGAEALGCAMSAVEPLRKGADVAVLGTLSDSPTDNTLYGQTFKLVDARDKLQELLLKYQHLAQTRNMPDTSMRKVTVRVPPVCVLPPNPSAVEKLEDQQCRNKPATLTTVEEPAPAGAVVSELPPKNLERVMAEARSWIDEADKQIELAQVNIDTLNSAATALWSRSVAIQKAVSEEVGKTSPNLAAVMAAAKGLKSTAFSLTGAPAFEPVAKAQSKDKRRSATAEDEAAVKKISAATEVLKQARRELSTRLRFALGSGHEEVRVRLNACSVKISGVTLTVTPGGDNVQVALKGTASFFVSGGSGAPRGSVDPNPKNATLTSKTEGGLNLFEFKSPDNAAVGEVYTLRFTDGRGEGEQVVSVRIVAAAKTSSTSFTNEAADKSPTKTPGTEDKASKPKFLGAIGGDRSVRLARA